MLRHEKITTESELEALQVPLDVVMECLTQRDQRLESELTHDNVDVELKSELSVVETNQKLLRDQSQAAWEKLNQLNDIKAKVDLEIGNKTCARDIDAKQLAINKDCSNISYKTEPMRVPQK